MMWENERVEFKDALRGLLRLKEYKLACRLTVMRFHTLNAMRRKEKYTRKHKSLMKKHEKLNADIALVLAKIELESL